jgi:hypothetical protein
MTSRISIEFTPQVNQVLIVEKKNLRITRSNNGSKAISFLPHSGSRFTKRIFLLSDPRLPETVSLSPQPHEFCSADLLGYNQPSQDTYLFSDHFNARPLRWLRIQTRVDQSKNEHQDGASHAKMVAGTA